MEDERFSYGSLLKLEIRPCISLLLLTSQIWANDRHTYRIEDIGTRQGVNFTGRSVYFLEGFSFGDYRRGDPNLTNVVRAEYGAIRQGIPNRVTPVRGGSYSLVGHSQGGLRALAHISEVQRQNHARLQDIDAIITVASINQGLPALEGGLPGFRSRSARKINIVGNGLRSAIGLLTPLAALLPRNELASHTHGAAFLLSVVPWNQRPFWIEAWGNPRQGIFHQIDDMAPRSDFIQQNVVQTVDHHYRARTGQRLTTEWRQRRVWPGIRVWYLWVGNVNVYSILTASEVRPAFDPNVPIGFIAGTNNSIFGMADNEQTIRNVVRGAEIFFCTVYGIHIAKNILNPISLLQGGVGFARDANEARRLMANLEGRLQTGVLRAPQGDGLVALSSQHIPRTFRDPNTHVTRTNLRNPILGMHEALPGENFVRIHENHQSILRNRRTFGTALDMIDEGKEIRGR